MGVKEKKPIEYCCVARQDVILTSYKLTSGSFTEALKTTLAGVKSTANTKITVPAEKWKIHILVQDGLRYACAAGSSVTVSSAFAFLMILNEKFLEHWNLVTRAAHAGAGELDRDFAPIMKKVVEDFNSGKSADLITSLQLQVEEVKQVMIENIDKVMERGDKLEDLLQQAENLENSSVAFRNTTKRVNRQLFLKNMKWKIIIGVTVTLFLVLVILLASGVIPTS